MRNIICIITSLLLALITMTGCKTTATTADTTDVPFIIADHYFVNNDVKTLPQGIIDNEADFNRAFGMAAVMGGLPTPVDFKKQFVIAATVPETDIHTVITPAGLKRDSKGLTLNYHVERGGKQSYTMQPLLMIVVDRRYMAPLTMHQE